MKAEEIIFTRRTIRKFRQEPIPEHVIEKIVEAARLAPSAANRQPLKYLVVKDPELQDRLFRCLRFAGYIKDYRIEKHERPTLYILVLVDTRIPTKYSCYDVGAAVENMMLYAHSQGIGSCWVAAIDRDRVREIFNIPDHFEIDCCVVFGYPAIRSFVEEAKGSIEYYLDQEGNFHVPKRPLKEIMFVDRVVENS